jgi:hypothetical protein
MLSDMYNSVVIQVKYFLIILPAFIFTFSCSSTKIIREFHDPVNLERSSVNKKLIKVHMTDGSLYLLDSLMSTFNSDTVSGYGKYYNQYREIIKSNKSAENKLIGPGFRIPISKVALFETNNITGLNSRILALTLVGVPTLLVTAYCILNPKACFGSCPTFYSWNGEDTVLMAEGFSSSILRSFEKQDIDMLYNSKLTGSQVNLKLTNEALETHVIRYADLLVFPRNSDERVFAEEDGSFYKVSDIMNPSSCLAPEGDCLDAVKKMDSMERYSVTDDANLAEKELIELTFNNVSPGEHGLLIGCRQTFLTTYLFYQSLAYMGNSAGNFAAQIESGDEKLQKRVNRVWEVLGGIEVFVQNARGKWIKVNQYEEMGPIASDVHMIRLPSSETSVLNIRLRLTKGLWRIDYLALARTGEKVDPVKINPSKVTSNNLKNADTGKMALSDTLNPLITLPGDSYNLVYDLPSASDNYELFLCSKGYYIEWMREPWLEEENLKKASMLFGFPKMYMRMAAKDFKIVEPGMEESFWKSRYVKNR